MDKETQFIFSSKHTQIAKGLAIFLMVWHHLFAFPDRIKNVSYQSIMYIDGTPIEQYIGDFGKICVAMFLFLSGYGLYKVYEKNQSFTIRDSIKRIGKFLKYYYIVFIIFIPIGLIFFQSSPYFQWDTTVFFYNLFALEATYNGEWWFVPLYVELTILFPFLMKFVKKSPTLVIYMSFIGFYLASFTMGLRDYFPNHEQIRILLYLLGILLGWQLVFMTGILCAKLQFFEKMDMYLKKFHLDNKFFCLLMILICFFSRQFVLEEIVVVGEISFKYNNYNIADFVMAPVFIFFFIKLIGGIKLLETAFFTLGKHSTVIWLTHTFFCYYYFQAFTYAPKYSMLILLWLLTITMMISMVINKAFTLGRHTISTHDLGKSQ